MTRMSSHDDPSRVLRRRLPLPAAILACLAAAALVTASAPAKPTASTDNSATGLQQDLDALVAAGAPGAILFVRNGNRTRQLTAGMSDLAHEGPIAARDHFKIASLEDLHGDGCRPVGRRGQAQPRRQRAAETARSRAEREQDHGPPAAQPYERPRRLRVRSALPEALLGRELRPLLVASPARPDGRLAQTAVRAGCRLVVLEHELRRRSADCGAGDRKDARHRAETQDLPPLHLDQTTTRRSRACRTHMRTATGCSEELPLVDVTGLQPVAAPGSGAIVSTVRDVADFYRALLAGRLLEPEQLKAMKTTVSERTGKSAISGPGYGLGVGHSGLNRPSAAVNVSCAGWGHSGE